MRFREVLLVIVLLAAGVVVYQAQTGKWDLHFGWSEGDWIGFGKEYTYEETQVFEAPIPSSLEVVNSHGWVEIRGADQETVQLTFQKKIWRRDEADAKAIADKLKYKVEKTADRLSLSTNREEFTKRNFETGFILVVPRRLAIKVENSYGLVKAIALKEAEVRNRHGEVFVSDIEGACILESSYEAIETQNLKGGCRVTNRHADIKVLSVAGDLQVDQAYGEVRFEDIGGKVEVTGSHSEVNGRRVQGSVSVESSYEQISVTDAGALKVRARHCPVEATDIRGNLDVETTYEPVTATNVGGDLRVSGNNVEVIASGIKGQDISVSTSYENVDLADFSAKVGVTLRHGRLVLRPSDLKFPIDVRNEYGDIDFYWPAGEASPFEAQTRGGSIHWELAEKPSLEKTNGTSLVKAFVEKSGRPGVFLSTSYGDILIQEKH
jgi:DUF4097 and DUF4098 domain-containing protein YvlB